MGLIRRKVRSALVVHAPSDTALLPIYINMYSSAIERPGRIHRRCLDAINIELVRIKRTNNVFPFY